MDCYGLKPRDEQFISAHLAGRIISEGVFVTSLPYYSIICVTKLAIGIIKEDQKVLTFGGFLL
jgi:hypothetical protein